jgi:2-(1,2-epoxy-1,2-dihydrophenyl)acetyl-CoA isomerase
VTVASVKYEPGRIAKIVFDQPGKKNAIDAPGWELLAKALVDFEADAAARVLVLTGAENEFCSGADLRGGITGSAESVASKLREVGDIIARLHAMPKPTLAVVPGVAAGVGLSLALCCDVVVAADRARFGAVFARVGLTPDGGASWLLPRLVGAARAKELVLTGRVIDATEADRIGLVNRVVPTEDLVTTGDDLAEQLAACSPVVAAESLALLDASWTRTFDEALAAEVDSQQAAVAARPGMDS